MNNDGMPVRGVYSTGLIQAAGDELLARRLHDDMTTAVWMDGRLRRLEGAINLTADGDVTVDGPDGPITVREGRKGAFDWPRLGRPDRIVTYSWDEVDAVRVHLLDGTVLTGVLDRTGPDPSMCEVELVEGTRAGVPVSSIAWIERRR